MNNPIIVINIYFVIYFVKFCAKMNFGESDMENITFAFMLTAAAGLSTGFGSLMALFAKRDNTRFLSLAMGFSAGVMIFVSLTSLLPEAVAAMREQCGKWNFAAAFAAFFAGVGITALIDIIVPDMENPHEMHRSQKDLNKLKKQNHNPKQLLRLGIMTAGVLALHNFPEGLATFISALDEPKIAYSIALAIALHNIPEGIAVYVPVFYATGSRKKAFFYSFLSGLAEPFGAVVGYFLLKDFFGASMFGATYAVIAGIMVYISFDELLPAAREYGNHHLAILGLFAGMFLIAASLAIL